MIVLKTVQKIGTLGGPKFEKKVKCLTKWVRLAPIELKLCRNDQAMIRTSILLILVNFPHFFKGTSRFFFFLPLFVPQNLPFFPYFPVQTAGPILVYNLHQTRALRGPRRLIATHPILKVEPPRSRTHPKSRTRSGRVLVRLSGPR